MPLFLPLYGYARVYDLRKIALEENARNVRMDGYVRALPCRDSYGTRLTRRPDGLQLWLRVGLLVELPHSRSRRLGPR